MKNKPRIIRFNREWICSDFSLKQGVGKTPSDAYNAWALKALSQREREYRDESGKNEVA